METHIHVIFITNGHMSRNSTSGSENMNENVLLTIILYHNHSFILYY